MAKHNHYGRWGEQLAADYLQRKGYSICHRNWKLGHRDLDIVAIDEKGGTLVIVEVKTRSDDAFMQPEEAVDWRKMRNMIVAANAYVRRYAVDLPVRFDIVSIVGHDDEAVINHIENAFVPR